MRAIEIYRDVSFPQIGTSNAKYSLSIDMTQCEHCRKFGGVSGSCSPLSSRVVVTHSGLREQHFNIQLCPCAGVIEPGGRACPVALAANKRHPAMMSRRQWERYEEELRQAKGVAAQQGRVFSQTIDTIRYTR